jgi:F0F1-type ATP synthase membrane subunit b/b'
MEMLGTGDVLVAVAFVVFWFVLMRFVLPRLGIST